MKASRALRTVGLAAALVCALAGKAHAITINNGGFEAGLSSWTSVNQLGSDGGFSVQTGTSSPVNGFSVAAPPQGVAAAMSDQQGPGAHALYQDFVVNAASGPRFLKFSIYLNSGADWVTPPTLDFATAAPNQQARVDLLSASSDPFSVAGGDVLQNLFQTQVGDPLVLGYATYMVDVTALLQAHEGETLRLRFAQSDNVNFLNFGVDDVAFVEGAGDLVPEPGSLSLALGGMLPLLGLATARRRRGAER
ncbi:MAG: hypothetical protein K0Q72_1703 [Armatimonadetes bacterium]|nr:hypothetical protein [Armatimonadota bacterium]